MFLPTPIKRLIKRSLLSQSVSTITRGRTHPAACLSYHRIIEPRSEGFDPMVVITTSADLFREQLKWLALNFCPTTLGDLVRGLKSGQVADGSVAVTFDDGYRDNLTAALPILEEMQVPATIFVCTGLIDGTIIPWWYELEHIITHSTVLDFSWRNRPIRLSLESAQQKQTGFLVLHGIFKRLTFVEQQSLLETLRPHAPPFDSRQLFLTWQELGVLARHPLITLAAHSHLHPVMRFCTDSELDLEMTTPIQRFSEELSLSIEHVAFPFGSEDDADQRESEAAARFYQSAWTTRSGALDVGNAQRLHSLPRVTVEHSDDTCDLAWKLRSVRLPRAHSNASTRSNL